MHGLRSRSMVEIQRTRDKVTKIGLCEGHHHTKNGGVVSRIDTATGKLMLLAFAIPSHFLEIRLDLLLKVSFLASRKLENP